MNFTDIYLNNVIKDRYVRYDIIYRLDRSGSWNLSEFKNV